MVEVPDLLTSASLKTSFTHTDWRCFQFLGLTVWLTANLSEQPDNANCTPNTTCTVEVHEASVYLTVV